MSNPGKYVLVERYYSRVNDFFIGESELNSPYSLNTSELAQKTLFLELNANDLLYWNAYFERANDTRAKRIGVGIEKKLVGNASEKVVIPAKSLADYLGFLDYHGFDGKKGAFVQAHDISNLIKTGNLAGKLIGMVKEYRRERRVPLIIRANQ